MKISKRDWAQLSAYLDGALSQREIKQLQKRMAVNPDLQAALESLRETKAILAHTPRLAVPQDFILTPAMIGAPRRQRQGRSYRLAAAALSFLFVGVLVLDVGSGMLKGGMPASVAPRAEEVMLEAAADEMEQPAAAAVEEVLEEEAAPVPESEGAVRETGAPDAAMEAEESADSFDTIEAEEPEIAAEAETKAVPEEADRAAGSEEDRQEESQDTQNVVSPTEIPQPEEVYAPPDMGISQSPERTRIPWIRILEITLGLGVVGFAAAAWITRRKNR